ncbi:MAG: response regulator with CheY-like receiver AAA-type ATPase and DNA-binding domain [Rhodospirillaceae bacterium]|nr:MAG: response regulator with CheY-like receiver AAA-type ATPase and DNA-binding domain [Rhodospirillaceae bacterium]
MVVDDERIAVRNLEHVLSKDGYEVLTACSGPAALAILEKQAVDVVLTDLKMERIDGMQVLRRCRDLQPDSEVILITGYASLESAVGAMKQGAFNYIAKPFRLDEVRTVVAEAMEKIRLRRETVEVREHLKQQDGPALILTKDPAMLRILEIARHVAPTECHIILTGASGTGKERIARFVHAASGRQGGPFVAVNCGAFTEDLLTNELFGHDKGAFTGADARKKGLIETAAGGTLFLDEITEMTPAMQVKLLRVIQEREFLRVGGTDLVTVDVRFIAATNRDLLEAVKNGAFREDLYFRLNVVTLHLMPLAHRAGDIPLLAYHFLERCAEKMKAECRVIPWSISHGLCSRAPCDGTGDGAASVCCVLHLISGVSPSTMTTDPGRGTDDALRASRHRSVPGEGFCYAPDHALPDWKLVVEDFCRRGLRRGR